MSVPTCSHTVSHILQPASQHLEHVSFKNQFIPSYSHMIRWSFGRGSIIHRIWSVVLTHTVFAMIVVYLTMETAFELAIPNVMMTVLGVVIGFVISYRAASGYDRYWNGRTVWSDVIKTCRICSRLVWIHVPLALHVENNEKNEEEVIRIMKEKRLAMDLIEGFAVALKHHLRGESGIYYEDMYHLVTPLHEPPYPISERIFHSVYEHSDGTSPAIQLIPAASTQIPHMGVKYRPKIAGEGRNIPLEIVRCLSEWFSVLEFRNTVPGSTMGSLLGCLASFEDSLSILEKILTVPLPFVYASHIRSTVRIYLFFLPFQLVDTFGWYAIPGVIIASFIYSGFVAAGDELEQPFGYDENDLDLELFCRGIIHSNIQQIRSTPCKNVYLTPKEKAGLRRRVARSLADGFDNDSGNPTGPGEGQLSNCIERETIITS